jgi:DNA-binding MarR family transcriptional regulator
VVEEALATYRHYGAALLRAATPHWEQLDLTTAQLKCLVVLACRGATTIGRLAELLGISKSSATITVDQLVQHGLVRRTGDGDDRRRRNVSLTPEGHTRIAQLHQGAEDCMRGYFERLDRDDLMALRDGLDALQRVMTGTEW